jgi:hypothetical protein
MLWQETDTWEANDHEVLVSMTLVRKSDGYTMTIHATSPSPWISCRLGVSAGGFGFQSGGVVPGSLSEPHSLALALSEALERMRVLLTSHYSARGKRCSVPTMMTMLRRELTGIVELS